MTLQCNKCSKSAGTSENLFQPNPRMCSGYLNTCRECVNKRRRSKMPNTRRPKGFFIDRKEKKLFYKYTLRYRDIFELFKDQKGICGVCGCHPTSERNNGHTYFAVDHCHTKGHVRKLLCMSCNVALGFMEDNPSFIRGMLKYVEMDILGS